MTISGALLLIPATGSFAIFLISLVFILFVYWMVLHVYIIMGVHGLSVGTATLIVLILPMCIVGLAILALIILTGGEAAGGLFEGADWFPTGRGKRNKSQSPTDR